MADSPDRSRTKYTTGKPIQRESRRQFIVRSGAVLAGAGMLATGLATRGLTESRVKWAPAGFVAHGAPTLALDKLRGAPLAEWGKSLPALRAVVVVSAHWQATPVTLGLSAADAVHSLIYDFSGFPPELYEVGYAPPTSAAVAEETRNLLSAETQVKQGNRALDHGVWVPLLHMLPKADVPVLQVSMPSTLGPQALFKLGQLLAPLRQNGVFILGSGNLVHNLGRLDWSEQRAPESWAKEFDDWVASALERQDYDALIAYRDRAPALELAHPTPEHYLPILVSAGAASVDGVGVRTTCDGFEYGNISRRSVQFG